MRLCLFNMHYHPLQACRVNASFKLCKHILALQALHLKPDLVLFSIINKCLNAFGK